MVGWTPRFLVYFVCTPIVFSALLQIVQDAEACLVATISFLFFFISRSLLKWEQRGFFNFLEIPEGPFSFAPAVPPQRGAVQIADFSYFFYQTL